MSCTCFVFSVFFLEVLFFGVFVVGVYFVVDCVEFFDFKPVSVRNSVGLFISWL